MKIPKVSVRVDGMMIIAVVVIAGVGYLWFKRKAITDTVTEVVTEDLNPAHQENIVNRAAQNLVGKDRLQGFFDHIFAGADILTPWNGVDPYAKQVWGID